MTKIKKGKFDTDFIENIKEEKFIDDWPVVYILNNEKEVYIGETVNIITRTKNHLQNAKRQNLKEVHVLSDETFNKSAVLDIESFLIKHMAADGLFELQNSNGGISSHDYYDREKYKEKFKDIWRDLKREELVKSDLHEIQNSNLFKYSPYKALTDDQTEALTYILKDLIHHKKHGTPGTTIVSSEAGTGKTVLAVYIMKLISDINEERLSFEDEDNVDEKIDLYADSNYLKGMKIGLVIPMQSLRETLKNVFEFVKGLDREMIISPNEIPDRNYDLLVVDEAHRLQRRWALHDYKNFDKNNKKLGLGEEGTELDWILRCSKNQIFFYDATQSVRPSDISKKDFDRLIQKEATYVHYLNSQLRCEGGSDYVDYIKKILSHDPPKEKKGFGEYEFKLFDDVDEMINTIKENDKELGLCRTVAGFAWKWTRKNKKVNDIKIGDKTYKWNTAQKDWPNSPNSINEIGCIHTIQGYDLNYTGVILGNEIKYDDSRHIYIDKTQYYDQRGKCTNGDEEALKEHILNIYYTMLTRGIKGTYVFACDEGMREYLKKYF